MRLSGYHRISAHMIFPGGDKGAKIARADVVGEDCRNGPVRIDETLPGVSETPETDLETEPKGGFRDNRA